MSTRAVSSQQEMNKNYLQKVERIAKLVGEQVADSDGFAGNNNNPPVGSLSGEAKDILLAPLANESSKGDRNTFVGGEDAHCMNRSPVMLFGHEERKGPRFFLNLPRLHFFKDEENQLKQFLRIHRNDQQLPWGIGATFLQRMIFPKPNENLEILYNLGEEFKHHCRYVEHPDQLETLSPFHIRPLRITETIEKDEGFTHKGDTVRSHHHLNTLTIRFWREEINEDLYSSTKNHEIAEVMVHLVIREAERILSQNFTGPHRAVVIRMGSPKIEDGNSKWINHLILKHGFNQPNPEHPEYLMGPEF